MYMHDSMCLINTAYACACVYQSVYIGVMYAYLCAISKGVFNLWEHPDAKYTAYDDIKWCALQYIRVEFLI